MLEPDGPMIPIEESLTSEMRQVLRRQVVLARLFGYPLALLLAGLTLFVCWLVLSFEAANGPNVWVMVTGVFLIVVCGGMTWVTFSGAHAQVQSALADLRVGRCVRVAGPVHVLHEAGRGQIFAPERFLLTIGSLELPISLYAAYSLEGVEQAIVTYTPHSHRVLSVRSPAGDLLFSAPSHTQPPVSNVIAV